jgi:cyanate lyase
MTYSKENAMTRDELTRKIISIKRAKGLTWKTIVAEIGGGSAVYLTAALLGQMKLRADQAERAAKLLGLDAEEQSLLQEIPYRGSLPTAVPSDPLIYRFYELVQVYGTTWKELIQEEFGDGIMSAIDFRHVDRAPARPERRPRQADPQRQIPAVQGILSAPVRNNEGRRGRAPAGRYRARRDESRVALLKGSILEVWDVPGQPLS